MLKSILTICTLGALGLFLITVIRPTEANMLVDRVLGAFVASPIKELPAKIVTEDKKNANIFYPFIKAEDTGNVASEKNSLTTENIIAATNAARAAEGLVPLQADEKLTASAKLKVEDMIDQQYFEHTSPKGVTVSDLGKKVGYGYVIMGENLALGIFDSAEDLVTAWMESPGHRANIVSTNYQDIGVYAVKAKYKGRTSWFAVQHFGTTRTACPAINQTLKKDIDTLNLKLKQQEAIIIQMRADLESTDSEAEEYEEKVKEFNALVKAYNASLAYSQQKISQYNAQVAAFNKCLAEYQKK